MDPVINFCEQCLLNKGITQMQVCLTTKDEAIYNCRSEECENCSLIPRTCVQTPDPKEECNPQSKKECSFCSIAIVNINKIVEAIEPVVTDFQDIVTQVDNVSSHIDIVNLHEKFINCVIQLKKASSKLKMSKVK